MKRSLKRLSTILQVCQMCLFKNYNPNRQLLKKAGGRWQKKMLINQLRNLSVYAVFLRFAEAQNIFFLLFINKFGVADYKY
jgi:hypothetical protein